MGVPIDQKVLPEGQEARVTAIPTSGPTRKLFFAVSFRFGQWIKSHSEPNDNAASSATARRLRTQVLNETGGGIAGMANWEGGVSFSWDKELGWSF